MRISFGRASANRSNEVSPTNLAHVVGSLNGRISMAIDGGNARSGSNRRF